VNEWVGGRLVVKQAKSSRSKWSRVNFEIELLPLRSHTPLELGLRPAHRLPTVVLVGLTHLHTALSRSWLLGMYAVFVGTYVPAVYAAAAPWGSRLVFYKYRAMTECVCGTCVSKKLTQVDIRQDGENRYECGMGKGFGGLGSRLRFPLVPCPVRYLCIRILHALSALLFLLVNCHGGSSFRRLAGRVWNGIVQFHFPLPASRFGIA
jgi:hypothetical protein